MDEKGVRFDEDHWQLDMRVHTSSYKWRVSSYGYDRTGIYHTLWLDATGQPHDTGEEWEDSDTQDNTQLVKAVMWPKASKGVRPN